MLVTKHLNFYVTWLGNILFNQHFVVVESRFCLTSGRSEGLIKLGGSMHYAHAFTAATIGCFEQDRVTHAVAFSAQQVVSLVVAMVTWNKRHIGFSHNGLCSAFRAHGLYCRCRRAYKN